jgi:hypothetical protein
MKFIDVIKISKSKGNKTTNIKRQDSFLKVHIIQSLPAISISACCEGDKITT